MASELVDLSIRQLGGIAQFECLARALGWTPSGSGCTCSPVLSSPSPVSDSAMGTTSADFDMADLQSALPTYDTPSSMATDHQAEGSNRAVASVNASSGLTLTRRQLCLGDGTILNFTKEEVGDPPAISFADDIPSLVQTWDDTSDDWDPIKCVLHIQGQPIALVYWRDVYIYGKKGQWKGIQNKWTDWQVCVLFIDFKLDLDLFFQYIVNSYCDLSPDGFWNRFSVNGKHMTYTAIVKHLCKERTAADRLLADYAKEEYGDEFASIFNYRCGNEIKVMKSDQKIAERYRFLHLLD